MNDRRRWLLPLLGAAMVASRLPLWGSHYFGTDAVHLGLSIDNYDLAAHSPHPPGYLFYVLLARALAAIGLDPMHAYLSLSLGASLATLALILALARRTLGEDAAAIAGVLFVVNPIAWLYGIVGESYAAEAACSAALGLLGLRALEPHERATRRLLVFSLAVGLVGGVRSSVTILSLPLWLYCAIRSPASLRARAASSLLLGTGVLAWLVPSAWLAGGLDAYLELSRALIVENVGQLSSPLLGASRAFVVTNLVQCAYWGAALLDVAGVLALLLWPLARWAAARRPRERPRLATGFVLLWILPALAFFLLMYASKPGYFLYLAPPVLLLVARGLELALGALPTSRGPRATRLPLLLLLVLLAAMNLWLFLVPVPGLGRPSAMDVTYNDLLLQSHLEGIRRLCEKSRCAVLYHLPPIAWRAGCVALPEVDAYQVQTPQTQPNRPPGTSYCLCRAGRVSCVPEAIIPLDHELPRAVELWLAPRVDRLVLLVEERTLLYRQLAARAPIQRARGARGLELRYLELAGRTPLQAGGLTIRHAPIGRDPFDRGGLRHGRRSSRPRSGL